MDTPPSANPTESIGSKFEQYPLIVRITIVLLFLILLTLTLYYGQSFLVPISLSTLLSILLFPIGRKFEKWFRIGRSFSSLLVILILLAVIGSIGYLCYEQIYLFAQDLGNIREKLTQKLFNIQLFIYNTSGMKPKAQIKWLDDKLGSLLTDSDIFIKSMLLNVGNILATIGIMIFYIFFMMMYREKFQEFFKTIVNDKAHNQMTTILTNTKIVIQGYISGVFTVVLLIATILGIGLFSMGIDFALFLAVFCALLNIVPYAGILTGAIITLTLTFITKDNTWYVTGVAILFFVTHWVEANILTPNIVGKKVRVNPLATFIMLIIGAELWGLMGMIMFIPFVGIIKVICDYTPALHPFSILLGTESYVPDKVVTVDNIVLKVEITETESTIEEKQNPNN